MRQHRPSARREVAWSPKASPQGAAPATTVRILDLPDRGNLPQLAPLVRLNGEWSGSRQSQLGQIVDELLDGRPVYPVPPRRVRVVHPLRRLLERATPPMLFFILLAGAQAITILVDAWSTGDWFQSIVVLILGLSYACTVTLLPAAVLIWVSASQRSFRLLLVGVLLWSTLPAVADLAWWIVRRSPGMMDQLGYAAAVGVGAAAVIACAGPAFVAVGLERARRGQLTSGRDTAWLVATLTALIALWTVTSWMSSMHTGGILPAVGRMDAVVLAGTIEGAALPLELACLLLLVYSCASAIVVEEPPIQFWQCAATGAAILAATTCYRIMTGDLLGPAAASVLAGTAWSAVPETAGKVAGSGLMLLAFSVPLWSAARGVVGFGRGAPEEIFTWGDEAQSASSEPIPMSRIVSIAAGADHALAVDRNGRVGAWGDDSVGQTDVPDGLSGVLAVAAGDGFSLALRSDGTVAAWGANNFGQTSVPPTLAGVTAIAAGRGFALALLADGAVVGWGNGNHGTTPVPSGVDDAVAISAGEYHGLALLRTGAIVAWGDNTFGQLDVPRRLGPATAISAGADFCLALLADGTVAAWGDNTYGQLDLPAGLTNVTAISAGAFHAVALRADGAALVWGGGGQWQGEAAHPLRMVDFKAVAAGDGFSLAIRAA